MNKCKLINFQALCGLFLIFLVQFPLSKALAQTSENVRVTNVHDGDTFKGITANGSTIKVRLEGIDAPELLQEHGPQSQRLLSSQILNRTVTVVVKGKDKYRRCLGQVFLGTVDINQWLIAQGAAWFYVKGRKIPAYIESQAKAESANKGLWKNHNAIAPWTYRKLIKKH